MCPGKFTALSQTKKDREIECAGNGDENRETTVWAFFMSLLSVWRADTESEKNNS